jgi:hypothetical protein
MMTSTHTICKSTICPLTCHEILEWRQMYNITFCSVLVLDVGRWLTPVYSRFTLLNDTVPIIREAEWAPGPVWKSVKNSSHNNLIFKQTSP